jgi:hypothetical protein
MRARLRTRALARPAWARKEGPPVREVPPDQEGAAVLERSCQVRKVLPCKERCSPVRKVQTC